MEFSQRCSLIVAMMFSSLLEAGVLVDGQLLENPFEPGGYLSGPSDAKGRGEDQLILNSILVSPSRRQASINGQFVREGDQILGAEVKKIAPDEVWLIRQGESLILRKKQNEQFKKLRNE